MPGCEWWDYTDEDVEGGVLEFDTKLELHLYKRRGESEPLAVWVSDDERFCCVVTVGQA